MGEREATFEEYRPAAAPQVIALWNRALGDRFPLTERLWRQNIDHDPNYAPGDGLLARDPDGALAGFVLTRRFRDWADAADLAEWRDRGWLVALAVAPERQGRGLGSRLLDRAEARLREQGATHCLAGGSPGHFLPGPPAGDDRARRFWEHRGYRPLDRVHDLRRALTGWVAPSPPPAIRDGAFRIAPAQPGEEGALLAFLRRAFPGRWRYDTAAALARGNPIEDVLVLKDRAGTIEGFLALWDFASPLLGPSTTWYPVLGPRYGGIGPVGIAERVRGRGLGLALVAAGVDALHRRGVAESAIDWTEITAFYGRLGYRVYRTYWRCAPVPLGASGA